MKYRYFFSFLIYISSFTSSTAQEVMATAGNYQTSVQGSLSWTLGETITETNSNLSGIFTQGFQQNYESILDLTEIDLSNSIGIYPIPFSSELNFSLENFQSEFTITVFDYQGRLAFKQRISFTPGVLNGSIDLSTLVNGVYLIMVESPEWSHVINKRIIKLSNNT